MKTNNRKQGWRIILEEELRHLWFSGHGLSFLLIFSILLSIIMVLLSLDPEINVVSHLNLINLTVKIITLIGIAVTLLLSANSISGERDNGTLECILLTPIKQSHFVQGKILSILSLWFGMVLIAMPYLWLVSQGSNLFIATLVILSVLGTTAVVITTHIGALISSVSSKNISSLIMGFTIMSVLIAPMQLPGKVQELSYVKWFINLDPFTAMAKYQQLVLVDGSPYGQHLYLLISSLLISIILLISVPWLIKKHMSLSGGLKKTRSRKGKHFLTILMVPLFLLTLMILTAPVYADPNMGTNLDLNKNNISMTAGDWDSLTATITNNDDQVSQPFIVTVNLVRVSEGEFADPEEIFIPITHYTKPLGVNETINLDWEIHGVFEGEFILFVTIASSDPTFTPIISSTIPLNILPNKILPLNQVISIVFIVPSLLAILLVITLILNRRKSHIELH